MDGPSLKGYSVLITGGTGSFGNAFVERLLNDHHNKPYRLVIFSRDEQKQEIMARRFNDPCMRFFIGDVRDESRLAMAMRGINYVIHAAALKIVPIAEYNPIEAIRTNIIGAENVIRAAIQNKVHQVLALSTDKAVNPINLYGATKLAAEKLFIAANNLSAGETRFSVVRYGNVVGSRGSVLPYFKKLKAEGKKLTVTDKEMTRFWIALPEAVEFVLSCMKEANGREIFIPKLPSIRVMDLVAAMKCDHEIIGIRPGEKIHEVLLTEDESRYAVEHYNRFTIEDKPFKRDLFRYSSDQNRHWVSTETLKAMVDEAPSL